MINGLSSEMKVLIVATEIGETNGGKGRYSLEMARSLLPQLHAQGAQVTVLAPKDAPLEFLEPYARIVRFPVPKNTGIWRAVWEEVYIPAYAWGTDLLLVLNGSLPLGPLRSKRKIVVFYDIHPLQHLADPQEFPGHYSRKNLLRGCYEMRKAARDADEIVTISDSVGKDIATLLHVSPRRMMTIPCAIDLKAFRPRPVEEVEAVRKRYHLPPDFYLFLGPPHAEAGNKKNLRVIVQAYSQAPEGADYLLPVVMAGGERVGRLREPMPAPLGGRALLDQCLYLGFVPDEDLPALYTAARALLFPSLHEGFGIPPLEAVACGTPVVAADRPAIPEVVGDAALLIDPLQPQSLLDALRKLGQGSVRQELIAKGFERARLYSWERSADLMLRLILEDKVRISGT
jgi:glycosyltransferase involved in cell wall biosynthesis